MGTARLKRISPSKFNAWVKRSGFTDEMNFWSSLSGLSRGTVVDHMTTYLSSLGYSGTPSDQFRKFLRDQTGLLGTTFDMGNQFFDGTFSVTPGEDSFILSEDGTYILGEDGGRIQEE